MIVTIGFTEIRKGTVDVDVPEGATKDEIFDLAYKFAENEGGEYFDGDIDLDEDDIDEAFERVSIKDDEDKENEED